MHKVLGDLGKLSPAFAKLAASAAAGFPTTMARRLTGCSSHSTPHTELMEPVGWRLR